MSLINWPWPMRRRILRPDGLLLSAARLAAQLSILPHSIPERGAESTIAENGMPGAACATIGDRLPESRRILRTLLRKRTNLSVLWREYCRKSKGAMMVSVIWDMETQDP